MTWIAGLNDWMERMSARVEACKRRIQIKSELQCELIAIKAGEEIRRIELAGQRIRVRRVEAEAREKTGAVKPPP